MTKKQKKVLIRIIVAAILLVILHFVPLEGLWLGLLYLIPYAVIGYDILRKAVLGIMHGEVFDENFLMAVATVGAMGLGEYSEGVAVMLFYQIGELFQSVAVGKSRQNISALMDIRPDYANIEAEDGSLEQVDPDDVEIGTIIVVRPGEKVPIDGVVVEGTSTLNTSALTGESVPREITVDQDVISGCVNLTGLLKIRTTKEFGESTVSKILDLVENSSMKKSKSENFITNPGCLLQCPGPGHPASCDQPDHGQSGSLEHLDHPCSDLPGNQLSLRAGHFHSFELLRRNRCGKCLRHFGEGIQLSGSDV